MYTLTYNGYTIENNSQMVLSKLTGIDRIPVRTSSDVKTGDDGGNIWERRYDMRPILIGGHIFAEDFTTYYALRDAMTTAFSINYSGLLTITLPSGVSKSITAKVIETPIFIEKEGETMQCEFEVMLKCEDPYWRSSTSTDYTCGLAVTGGSPVSAPVPTPLGYGDGNRIVLTNNGDVPALVTFKIENACVNPTVTRLDTSEYFQVETTLIDGDLVEVYENNTGKYCTYNSTTNYYAYLGGDIFEIPVGASTILFGATTYTATAKLTISITERFLSL